MSKPKHEVADILNFGFEDYLIKHYYRLPKHKVKTARAISNCRTANLGPHKDLCSECGHIRYLITPAGTDIVQNARIWQRKTGLKKEQKNYYQFNIFM